MTQHYTDPFNAPWRFAWIRLMLEWHGGILQMLWMEWLLAILLCTCALIGVYFGWPNEYSLSPSVQSLHEAVTFVARRFQAAIALMLGFYTMQVFNRWREARAIEGNAMGTINDIALQLAWRIKHTPINEKNEKNEDEKKPEQADPKAEPVSFDVVEVRLRLIRWLNLSHAMVVGDVYEMKYNAFSSMDNLVTYGLATEKEGSFLDEQTTRYKYVAPFLWFMELTQELEQQGMIDAGTVNVLSTGVVDVRHRLADLYAVRDVPIPLSYRQLTNITVRFYMVILLIAAVSFEMTQEYEPGSLSRGSFWIIMVFAFEYFLFVGWLTVADAVGNPFRAWADQLDWDDYVIKLNLNSMLIATRFQGEATQVETTTEDSSAESTLVQHALSQDKDVPPESGWKAKRKLIAGF
jgi:predicted membrane chloride channel (bestrophin family)